MNIMQTSTRKYFSYFQKELTAWKSFLILTTSLMLFACNVEVVSTNAPENKCAIPDYAEMNPKECGKGAANSRVPNLSFDGVSTTEGVVGKLISISPSRLETNGSDIKACKITPDLPAALTINSSTCVISGNPTAVLASTTYAVIATNSAGPSLPASVTIKVGASAPNLSYSGAAGTNATVGSLMSVTPKTLSANGASITACAIKSGTTTLPQWASVNATTCAISGTPNAVLASTSYTLVATNSVGQSADAAVTLSVAAAVPSLSYSNSSGRIGTVNTPMTITPSTFSANGASITGCAVKLGTTALPSWASLNTTTCVISGTPNVVLASTSYTLIAANSVGQSADAVVTLSVATIPSLSYSGSSGRSGTFGIPMSVTPSTLLANGASITACGIKVPTTALPSWASVNPTTCVISGTPSAVLASTTYTLVATNSVGQSGDATVTLSVAAVVPALSYSNSSGRSGTVNTPMTVNPSTLSANGAQITGCAVKSGTTALPAWASVNATTCVISGTPNGSLTSTTYTIVATNSVGQSADALVSLSVGTNILTPIAIEAFPDTTNHPAITWTPNVRFSSVTNDNIGLYSDTLGTLINTPVTATAGLNTFLANPVSSLGQTNTIYAKNPLSTSYTTMGTYRTKLPPNISVPGVSGIVYAAIRDSVSAGCTAAPGCVIVAGDFKLAGGVSANAIARWNPTTSKWSTLGTGLDGAVAALAIDANGQIYAGGDFTTAGAVSVNRIAKWNPTTSTWSALGTGLTKSGVGYVYALALDGNGNLYAGGEFTSAGGVSVNNIAKWNMTNSTWSALGAGLNNRVYALAVDGSGSIYVGGKFTSAGGNIANYIARYNSTTSTWSALGTGLNSDVIALAIDGAGNLYAGGRFSTANGTSASRVARWNPTNSTWSALGAGTSDEVYALAIDGSGNIYAGGAFLNAGAVNALHIARWNPTTMTWGALGTGAGFLSSSAGYVTAIAVDGSGNIYPGGLIDTAGDVKIQGIARWNPTTMTWGALGTGLNKSVTALAVDGSGKVYVGGAFNTAGDVNASNIAKWDPATSSWSALGTGINFSVDALTVDGSGNLYAGGIFNAAGGVAASNIARWNPTTSTWSTLGSGTNGGVYALAIDSGGNIYAGGTFTAAGDVNANYIAKWNPTTSTWSALGTGLNNSVDALAVDGSGNLYAGGSFTTAGGVNANYIAKWNPTNSTWSALGTGTNGSVDALTFDGTGNIYAGGIFSSANGVSAQNVAKWSPTTSTWSALGAGLNSYVYALAVDGSGNLYAGGLFSTAGGVSANKIARWNPTTSTWSALGTGLNDTVNALAVRPSGDILVGGRFQTAGSFVRPFIAQWISAFESWF